MRDLRNVSFTTLNKAWTVGSQGKVITTINGGNTWSTLTSSAARDLRSVGFISGGLNGWLCRMPNYDDGHSLDSILIFVWSLYLLA